MVDVRLRARRRSVRLPADGRRRRRAATSATSAGTAASSSRSGCTCRARSRITTRGARHRARQHPRLGAAARRSAARRRRSTLEARMETQSILFRTLWLFGLTFVAVAITFALLIWWVLRRGARPPMWKPGPPRLPAAHPERVEGRALAPVRRTGTRVSARPSTGSGRAREIWPRPARQDKFRTSEKTRPRTCEAGQIQDERENRPRTCEARSRPGTSRKERPEEVRGDDRLRTSGEGRASGRA